MKRYLTTLLILISIPAFGQVKNCFCEMDTLMNNATISCETKTFTNKTKIYWQYNCDNIWLTFENINGQRIIIDEVPTELYSYTYRLGFHLIKEFDKTILFRSGCLASGSCIYNLIDKNTGKKLKEFHQLICIDTDAKWENAHKYNFNFIVYLSNNSDSLIIYFVDNKKTLKIPFKEKLTSASPQHQFDEMTLESNILTIYYSIDNNIKKNLKIDLNDKKYNN